MPQWQPYCSYSFIIWAWLSGKEKTSFSLSRTHCIIPAFIVWITGTLELINHKENQEATEHSKQLLVCYTYFSSIEAWSLKTQDSSFQFFPADHVYLNFWQVRAQCLGNKIGKKLVYCGSDAGSLSSTAVLRHALESFGVPSRRLWSQGGLVGNRNLIYWKFASHGWLERNTLFALLMSLFCWFFFYV